MTIIALVVFLILVGLAFWAVRALAGAFGIPAPIVTVIQVLIVLFAVIYLLNALGATSGGPVIRLG
jgi:uncharacterized membrane protein YwzB